MTIVEAKPAAPAIDRLDRFLAGGWTVTRTIRDRRAGVDGRFDGRARFAAADMPAGIAGRAGLRYDESGHLSFGEHAGPAQQTYFYVFPDPDRAQVHFRDGRPFHTLDLSAGTDRAVHGCGADLYRARFRVLGPDRWTVVWQVRGPRKRLLIASRYDRAAAIGPGPVPVEGVHAL